MRKFTDANVQIRVAYQKLPREPVEIIRVGRKHFGISAVKNTSKFPKSKSGENKCLNSACAF